MTITKNFLRIATIAVLFSLLLLVMARPAHADTSASASSSDTIMLLQAQAHALMAQFTAMQASSSTNAPASTSAPAPVVDVSTSVINAESMMASGSVDTSVFSRDLHEGSVGHDVTMLQKYLNSNGFIVTASGQGSPGNEVQTFGHKTAAALVKLQASAGITPATGYFGPKTRAYVASHENTSGSVSATSPTPSPAASTGATVTQASDIIGTAISNGHLNTFLAAVQAANLISAFKGNGPFTVFAPSDSAFAKLGTSTLQSLLQPANIAQLQDILKYHVVSGKWSSANLYDGQILTTVEDKTIVIHKSATGLMVNASSTVTTPDITASNGVIHIIDTVLMPQ